uniref:DUF3747 domain-containing protein n=1 Tax=Panagrellus redivivus TaxID=6233 RepID=A0A7E4VV95_PANRE
MLNAAKKLILLVFVVSNYIHALPAFTTLHFLDEPDYHYDFIAPKSLTDIECYNRLDKSAVDHTFRLNADSKLGLTCIVELPSWTTIEIEQLNFATNRTSARVLSGNDRMRPVLASLPLTRNNLYERSFNINCLYGFLVVRKENPGDNIVFKILEHPEKPGVEFLDECFLNNI